MNNTNDFLYRCESFLNNYETIEKNVLKKYRVT